MNKKAGKKYYHPPIDEICKALSEIEIYEENGRFYDETFGGKAFVYDYFCEVVNAVSSIVWGVLIKRGIQLKPEIKGRTLDDCLKRGYEASDFYCDDESGFEITNDVDRTAKSRELKKDFEKIKRKSKEKNSLCPYKENYEILAFLAMKKLYENFESGKIGLDEAKKDTLAVFSSYKDQRQICESNKEAYRRQQQNIKRSGEVISYLVKNAKTASDRELLLKMCEYLSCERGEGVTFKIIKERLSEKDAEEQNKSERSA